MCFFTQEELEEAINKTTFYDGICPIFQNVTAAQTTSKSEIKENLIKQLTGPVKWTQIMQKMISHKVNNVTEVGPGKVLQGLFKKVNREIETSGTNL